MSLVTAIIPTWNRADLLRSILTNLASQNRPPDQVIVVDNGSTDSSESTAREFDVEWIALPENRGFAGAVNEGVRRAKGDWILIVNNDVVLASDWLELLLASAQRENASFATGKLLSMSREGHIDGTWDLVSRGAHAWRCGYGRPDGDLWRRRREIAFAPMTAALFRRRVFCAVGLLDVRFEAYYEDVDFGIRCALAGFEGIYEPAAVATHQSKSTLGKNSARVLYLTARNQIFILAKHFPASTVWRFGWPIFVGQLLSVIGAASQGHILAALRGKCEGLWRWQSFRRPAFGTEYGKASEKTSAAVEQTLAESERQIRELQSQIGFDPYWRLYFSLVRSG
jgi:GT2 family glycosyltransferase